MSIISVRQTLLIMTIILFQNISKCATNTKSYKNILSPLRSIASSNIGNAFLQKSSNISRENIVFSTNKAKNVRVKKWQVGRVSRKHYEIINMLWRKTKMPFDVETTNEINHPRKNSTSKNIDNPSYKELPTFLPSPILPASTPSFIEFYYLDESYDINNSTLRKHINFNVKEEKPIKNLEKFEFAFLNPVLTFHVNNPYYKRSTKNTRYPTNRIHQRIAKTFKSPTSYFTYISFTQSYKPFIKEKVAREDTDTVNSNLKEKVVPYMTLRPLNNTKVLTEKTVNTETCPYTIAVLTTSNENISSIPRIQASTAYDRIKFFEMYDKNTYEPNYQNRKSLRTNDIELIPYENENDDKKILLEHVDQNMGHDHDISHKIKHAKKHIVENNREFQGQYNIIDKKAQIKRVIFKTKNGTTFTIKEATFGTAIPDLKTRLIHQNVSKPVTWSEYPFAAVYIYEPLQDNTVAYYPYERSEEQPVLGATTRKYGVTVHCDAAGISQHWLITAGSCLSRHHKKPGGTGRSAFVTYCGDTWWSPERVAYVKYSVVHPRYHSREKSRRYLYNIGLIQVVTSMASACAGWSPIPLMSHKLISGEEESKAIAIGWGLDRFDIHYPSIDLPRLPLSLYESRLYSETCPGNSEYSKSKRLEEDDGIRNVYCLAVPPYLKEENDPVHGSLLLVGGKLIALYLQEERRSWGEQCAQYTGTWRLIPWVLDVAHEPDETDSFTDF